MKVASPTLLSEDHEPAARLIALDSRISGCILRDVGFRRRHAHRQRAVHEEGCLRKPLVTHRSRNGGCDIVRVLARTRPDFGNEYCRMG